MGLLVVLHTELERATRAARKLHVTQSAVSNALSRLREKFQRTRLVGRLTINSLSMEVEMFMLRRHLGLTYLSCGVGLAGCSAHGALSSELSPRNTSHSTSSLSFVPDFPGAGESGADEPLSGGKLCDYVPSAGSRGVRPVTDCFYAAGGTQPIATIEQVLECAHERDAIRLRLTFDPAFVDNSYGANAIGWAGRNKGQAPGKAAPAPKQGMAVPAPPAGTMPAGMLPPGPGGKAGHTWKNLVGSDHAELAATNADGETVIRFKLDYISESAKAPSGYETLGASGGDGRIVTGRATDIVDYTTSIDRNLNERGYGAYIVDSPATDADYTPNIATPNWDYRVVYEAWIDIDAFGPSGFGGATIEFVHASPSKAASDTVTVKHDRCPCEGPDNCDEVPPPKCQVLQPDDPACDSSDVPPPPGDQESEPPYVIP